MADEIPLAARIRIEADVLSQELGGEAVLLHLRTGVYLGLDAVGLRIWQLLGHAPAVSEIVSVLVREYDVDRETCTADVLALVAQLRDHQLVRVVA